MLFVVIQGVAVGCGWQAFVAYVNVGCYYVIGVPLGRVLGFYLDLKAKVLRTLLRCILSKLNFLYVKKYYIKNLIL